MYEYYMHDEMEKAAKERADMEADKIEEEKEQAAQAWADQMEAEEAKSSALSEGDLEWMRAAIEDSKSIFGEDFGEDIKESFE